jgi:hypothetical protein
MEDCLNGHAFKMPALSNHDQNNLISESQNNGNQVEVQRRSSSEFLYHINHPEDVGAVVTSFCKVIQVCNFIHIFQQFSEKPNLERVSCICYLITAFDT